jgi:ERCC4-type nuclease
MARLVIDNREHKLIEQIKIPFETSSLDIGDVVIGDVVTLERKTIDRKSVV